MNIRRALLILLLLAAISAWAQTKPNPKFEKQFQSAVAEFHAGNLAEAAAQLETLLPRMPKSYEVHELLGLVYAAQSQNAKALQQFETAVRLKPGSAAAHTNLAAALVRGGKPTQAAEQFRNALDLDPQDYNANHNLAELYIRTGKLADGTRLLEKAQRTRPASYDNGYDLALAYSLTDKLNEARNLVQTLLQQKDTGELHNLLGQIDEKDGQFVQAVNEFGMAAHLDPSEQNLFDWASELLLHRTYEPAIEVFEQATQRYSDSPRLFIGLGMALYSRGKYDEAVKALLTASDLDPADARCYLFLSKAYDSSPTQAEAVTRSFRRFSELQPGNALARYYYAMSLWKGKRAEGETSNLAEVEALLRKAIALDPALPEAHMQLGNLYADQRAYAKSIPEYSRALELNANLPDAHYRLAQDYVHTGQKDQAQSEFAIYQKLRAQHMADIDKERAEVQQFVYTAKAPPVKQ